MRDPKHPKMYKSTGTLLDVDPDKVAVYQELKALMPMYAPDGLITGPAPWKVKDRGYFFDNPDETMYARLVSEEERSIPLEILRRLQGDSFENPEEGLGPHFFKRALIINISPGCRLKISIDRLNRKPKSILVFAGVQPTMPPLQLIPVYQSLPDYMTRTHQLWARSLQTCDAKKGSV